jgi:hypothetical protein
MYFLGMCHVMKYPTLTTLYMYICREPKKVPICVSMKFI